jgi:hypothetical protein
VAPTFGHSSVAITTVFPRPIVGAAKPCEANHLVLAALIAELSDNRARQIMHYTCVQNLPGFAP